MNIKFNNVEKISLTTNNIRKSLQKKGYNDIDLCHHYMSGFTKVGKGNFANDGTISLPEAFQAMATSYKNQESKMLE